MGESINPNISENIFTRKPLNEEYIEEVISSSTGGLSEGLRGGKNKLHWFSDFWKDYFISEKPIFDFLKSKLEGQTVVDLGCGINMKMRPLLEKLRVGRYVGVDRYFYGKEKDFDYTSGSQIFEDDLLRKTSEIGDGQANFVINGIDGFIIHSDTYHELLAAEMIRATKTGGIIFGTNSRVLEIIAKNIASFPLKEISLDDKDRIRKLTYIFEKN